MKASQFLLTIVVSILAGGVSGWVVVKTQSPPILVEKVEAIKVAAVSNEKSVEVKEAQGAGPSTSPSESQASTNNNDQGGGVAAEVDPGSRSIRQGATLPLVLHPCLPTIIESCVDVKTGGGRLLECLKLRARKKTLPAECKRSLDLAEEILKSQNAQQNKK